MINVDTTILPEPFCNESFTLLRHGVYDDHELSVYINESHDFAFLNPIPETDYTHYQPRVKNLNLTEYKKKLSLYQSRFEKIQGFIGNNKKYLEIGAGDAEFLAFTYEKRPDLKCACVEPDADSSKLRDQYEWLQQFSTVAEAKINSYDVISLFHVLEHIIDPVNFLVDCSSLLAPDGNIIIEIPALTDPLISLYQVPAYEGFFFQKQHPYYYSIKSLRRLLEKNRFEIIAMLPHQRYGLENHLTWLRHGKPGGNDLYREMFLTTDTHYRKNLEKSGHTDSLIAIAKPLA